MICWDCYWGWSKPVAEIYLKWLPIVGEEGMKYGPAHIIWEEENFDHASIDWCIQHFDEY